MSITCGDLAGDYPDPYAKITVAGVPGQSTIACENTYACNLGTAPVLTDVAPYYLTNQVVEVEARDRDGAMASELCWSKSFQLQSPLIKQPYYQVPGNNSQEYLRFTLATQ